MPHTLVTCLVTCSGKSQVIPHFTLLLGHPSQSIRCTPDACSYPQFNQHYAVLRQNLVILD